MHAAEWNNDAQSVIGRVSVLLGAFNSADAALGISELARRTGLPKSTVHRLVRDLATQGFLDREGSAVRLGLRLFELGQLVPHQRVLREAATPILADLRQATGHTVHLATLEGRDVVYVDILRGNSPSLPSRVGGRVPAHATGVGKVILACSSSAVVRGVLSRNLERISARTIVNGHVLAQQFEKIRTARVGFDFEESAPGVICVASPIIDATGNVLGALSLSGWSSRMDPQRLTPIVRSAALALSRTLKSPSA